MNKISPIYRDVIYGISVKSECYYVIRNKTTYEYDVNSGEETFNVMDANWYSNYTLARQELATFDEPEEYEIIRMSCVCSLEEVME